MLVAFLAGAPARAQDPVPRGDTDCSVTLTAADLVSSIAALGGAEGCGNDDCDRDGAVTSADVECTTQCLFDRCPIPDAAPRVTSVTPEFGSGIAPFSTVRVVGTGFGPAGDPRFVSIGGVTAEVVEVVDADTLLVLVPLLDPGPAEMVVSAAVDGFPFPLTIGEAAPVGEPDTFDGVLDLIGVAAERFSELALDSLYREDAQLVREQLDRMVAEIAARRADLAADPGFTPEAEAFFDAALDASGTPEELRGLIADIEAILAQGEGGGAQVVSPTLAVARKARTLKAAVAAVAAASAGGPITAGAVLAALAIETTVTVTIELLRLLVIVGSPPVIVEIVFTDANGMRRPYATAGGTVRIAGARFSAEDTLIRIDTARGARFFPEAEERDGDLVATLPDRFGFCGPVGFTLLRTVLDVASNRVPARVQPELLDLALDRARPRQRVTVQVRGTYGCRAAALLIDEFPPPFDPFLVNVTARSAYFTPDASVDPKRYELRIDVEGVRSAEQRALEIAPGLTGVGISCPFAELKLPPDFPPDMVCRCTSIPTEAMFGGVVRGGAVIESKDGSLAVTSRGFGEATVAAKVPTDSTALTCKATFATRRSLISEPFIVKVVDEARPMVTLSEPPAEVDPGASIDLMVMAEDNDFVTRIVLRATGDAVVNGEQEQLCTLLESNCTKSFKIDVKRGGFSNRQVSVQAEAVDGSGNMGMSTARTFNVRRQTETTPPVVTIQNPRSGGRVRAGDMVQVSVRVTDEADGDSGVEKVRVDVTGPAVASGLVPSELALPQPLKAATRAGPFTVRPASEISTITNRTITIVATGFDAAGNMASETITVTAGAPPVITSVFPSPAVAGEIIRIVGDGFGEEQGSSTVSVGGGVSGLTSWSNNEILALLPDTATGMVSVVVTVDGVASNAFPFTVLGSGDVRITLIWDDVNDLDLLVTDPNGDVIFFGNRSSPSGGMLDVDANANCGSSTPSPRENIFWPTDGAPTGTYNVAVSYFRGCTKPPRPSSFTVNVVVDGRFMTLMEGSISGGGRQSASFTRGTQ